MIRWASAAASSRVSPANATPAEAGFGFCGTVLPSRTSSPVQRAGAHLAEGGLPPGSRVGQQGIGRECGGLLVRQGGEAIQNGGVQSQKNQKRFGFSDL